MRRHRVVITGMGAVSPYGEGVNALTAGLDSGVSALSVLPDSDDNTVGGVQCRVAGLVPAINSKRIPREWRRAMSPMSIYACLAAWEALTQAGFIQTACAPTMSQAGFIQTACAPITSPTELAQDKPLPRMGVSIGSTLGSPQTLHEFFTDFLRDHSVESVRSTTFFKAMGHTVASSVALACGCTGRLIAPAAACASGLAGMGLGYECIAAGRESIMLCGGADEFHMLTAATFDRLGAATHAADPACASLPFDLRRAGIVCGEGAGVLVLESLTSAQERGVPILAEVLGFGMRTSANIAQPDVDIIGQTMREALDDAECTADDVAFVNAHATATVQGDAAEGQAIAALFGSRVPVNSLKGHLGHTMAACGALESIASIESLHRKKLWPTLGLTEPDPACGKLAHVRHYTDLPRQGTPLLKNCFALGGCVCSLVLGNVFPDAT